MRMYVDNIRSIEKACLRGPHPIRRKILTGRRTRYLCLFFSNIVRMDQLPKLHVYFIAIVLDIRKKKKWADWSATSENTRIPSIAGTARREIEIIPKIQTQSPRRTLPINMPNQCPANDPRKKPRLRSRPQKNPFSLLTWNSRVYTACNYAPRRYPRELKLESV